MNRLLIIFSVLFCILWGCSEDNLDAYDGRNSVYFAVRNPLARPTESLPYMDTTVFSFINFNVADTVFYLRINSLGDVVSHDRTFGVEVVASSTTAKAGEHYQTMVSQYVIPADSVSGVIPVKLLRSPELRDSVFILTLHLTRTTDFDLALENKVVDKINNKYVDLLQHVIVVSDLVMKPLMWDAFTLPGKEPDMGSVWSVDKYILTNYLLDIGPSDWDDRSTMAPGRRFAISIYMRNYLTDMIAKGTAVRDDAEKDGFMRVKGVIVPEHYDGKFVTVKDLMK